MLAPMEGLTNRWMRRLIAETGAVDVVATEFIRITSASQKIAPVERPPSPTELQIQLMASEPEAVGGVIQHLKRRGILQEDDWIDLNVGCPSTKVNARGAGAALLTDPERLLTMLNSMRESHPNGRLSMKTRIGFNSSEDLPMLLNTLQRAPIDLITIHARSQKGRYDPDALEVDKLSYAVETLPYPVIGNGDIFTVEDAQRMLATGVAGIMCGRGAISNPFLFREIRENDNSARSELDRKNELLTFANRYAEALHQEEQELKGQTLIGSYKEFSYWFSRNPLIGAEYFSNVKRMGTLEEIQRFNRSVQNGETKICQ
jgi:tRNA-dihydrouridine synthase